MAILGIDKDFLREFARLERPVQERVTEVFAKFAQSTHAGLHLEKINNVRDERLRTIRVNQFWRGVVLAPDTGDSYTLLKVLPHDEAYAWAQRRRVSVNTATGRIEIRDVDAIEATVPELTQMAERGPERVFDLVSDADLRRLGVDENTLQFARVVTDVIQLEAARSFLPQGQWDALYGLAAGLTPEEVWAEIAASQDAEGYDPADVDAAVRRSNDRVVLVNGPEELMQIFRHPMELWRVYLHPTQYAVAHGTFRGPARVSGGPGTGKTVVAMHRARYLAELSDGPVLLTTFTSTLSASLEAGVAALVEDPTVRERIDVRHVDQIASQAFRDRHGLPALLTKDVEHQLWKEIAGRLELPFNEIFLGEEWRQVILAQRVRSAGEYLAAKRQGRGRPLGTRQRAQVWQVIWDFERELEKRRLWTYETVCVEATRLLEGSGEKPYRHVVVDEAQDLSPVQWRLLRALVPEAANDLFIAGDTHQRIYNNRVSLREVGIHIAGRSSKLGINYRTTAEILAWSFGVLRNERVDDLDGSIDSIAGCRSEVHGYPPTLRGASSRDREVTILADQVAEWVESGIEPDEIGVAARSNSLASHAVDALRIGDIPAWSLAKQRPESGGVAVGTMHRMKGLEFRCVGVIGVNRHNVPPSSAVTTIEEDETTHLHDMQRERCLLFVACTRAREQLYVSWHGEPSVFLPT